MYGKLPRNPWRAYDTPHITAKLSLSASLNYTKFAFCIIAKTTQPWGSTAVSACFCRLRGQPPAAAPLVPRSRHIFAFVYACGRPPGDFALARGEPSPGGKIIGGLSVVCLALWSCLGSRWNARLAARPSMPGGFRIGQPFRFFIIAQSADVVKRSVRGGVLLRSAGDLPGKVASLHFPR